MKAGVLFGGVALTFSLLLLALRWCGRYTRPGENDFDPIAAGVMFGSIALVLPALLAAGAGFILSLAAIAKRDRPFSAAVWTLALVAATLAVVSIAWRIGPQ